MPQPIDPNTEFMKVNAVERIQQALDRASLAAQARQSATTITEQARAETMVSQTQERHPTTDRELKRRAPYIGKRVKKEDANDPAHDDALHTFYTADEHTEVVDDPDVHGLDVTI